MKLLKSFGFLALGISVAMGACGGGTKKGGGGNGGSGGDEGGSGGDSGGSGGDSSGSGGSSSSGGSGGSNVKGGSGGSSSTGGSGGSTGTGGSGSGGSTGTGGSAPVTGGSSGGDGLIGSWSFDEGSGSMAKDASNAKNDGKIVKGTTADAAMNPSPQWVDGKKGKALQFNGTDDWVNVPKSATLDSTGDTGNVTLAGWVKLTGFATGEKPWSWLASRHENGTAFEHFGLGVSNGAPACSIHFSFAVANQAIPLNTWVHLAMTYDALTCTVFQNGMQVANLDVGWPIAADSTQFVIGGNQNLEVVKEFMTGVIDEVKLYNKVLTPAEIMGLQ